MVVLGEFICKLNFIFPANIKPLSYADLVKQPNDSVDTSSVNLTVRSVDKFMHCHWFLPDEEVKHQQSLAGNTIAVVL
jgi:hypothetical protein